MLDSTASRSLPAPPVRHRRRVWLSGGLVVLLLLALAIPGVRHRLPGFDSGASPVEIAGAFVYQQQRPLSCEYASVHIAATMAGYTLSEYDIEAVVLPHENPHKGFRGNIHGEWGNTTDYGVYNGPLAAGLSLLGVPHESWYGDRADLERHLRAGHPTVVWLGMRGEGHSTDHWDADGDRYQLTTWMHVMTAYGFDGTSVYLSDPGTTAWQVYTWDEFETMWGVMDGMALSIIP